MDYNVSLQVLKKHKVPPHSPKFPDVEDVSFFQYNPCPLWHTMIDNKAKASLGDTHIPSDLPLMVQFRVDALDDFDGDPEDLERGDINLHFYMCIQGHRYSTPFRETAEAFLKYCGYTVPEMNLEFEVAERIKYLEEKGYC